VTHRYDAVIVGTGLAGLRAAMEMPPGARVALLSKVYPTRSHSGAAQGGIAAALGNEEPDMPEWHTYDTVKGGDYLTDQDAAEVLAADGPRAIFELEHLGVPFNRRPDGRIAQRAFGGHTRDFGAAPVKRACHAADRTGRVVLDTLYMESVRRGFRVFPEFSLVDILLREGRVAGLVAMEFATGELHVFETRLLLLATGGFGRVYRTTSNCFANTGDGVYLAYRAGVPLQDMEFVQFHPTGIHGLGVLISEAARGEGGFLRNGDGQRFMDRYAPTIRDLAARDVVSRAILTEIREGRGIQGGDCVHLDLRHLGSERISEKLSEIASFIRIYLGLDPSNDLIPVSPTCHYMMGGIPTNLDGQVRAADGSIVPGFYAVGECACISVHGANRLGCNSLLDLVVFGRRAGQKMVKDLSLLDRTELSSKSESRIHGRMKRLVESRGEVRVPDLRSRMQSVMNRYGLAFRSEPGLRQGLAEIRELAEQCAFVKVENRQRGYNAELMEALELESLLGLSELILVSALQRTESRGAHYREDHPLRNDKDWLKHTLVRARTEGPEVIHRPVVITRFEPKERVY